MASFVGDGGGSMLIVNQAAERPQTHALIIAPGAPGGLPPIHSSTPSASVLSSWLQKDFVNPEAPLGSLDILTAPHPDTTLPPATGAVIASAVKEWLQRAALHPDNIALFYFAGHGFADPTRSDQLLVPSDASQETLGDVLSVNELLKALDHCDANRQLVLIDASWEVTSRPHRITLDHRPPTTRSQLNRGVLRACGFGQLSYAPGDGLGFFTEALMRTLRVPQATSPITLSRLLDVGTRLMEIAKAAGIHQEPWSNVIGDFVLHYPPGSLPTATAVEPEETAPDATTKPAPRKAARTATPRKAAPKTKTPQPSPPGEPPEPDAPITSKETPPEAAPRPDLDFFDDDAELDADALGRAGLAVMIARRLHTIWKNLNVGSDRRRSDTRASFVMHLDAPWGGGKTTFANFVARALNPYGFGKPASFLVQRCGEGVNLSAVFAQDPPAEGQRATPLTPDAARPWIIVPFNAWQMEHCTPPWWAFYQVTHEACFKAIRTEGDKPVSVARKGGRTISPAWARWSRWLWLWTVEFAWRLFTPKLVIPLIGTLLSGLVFLIMMAAGMIDTATKDDKTTAVFDPTSPIGLIMLGLTGLTVIGGAVSLFVESLAPGVNPLAERLGLGNSDPLARFRKHFQDTLTRIKRPVLVVIDDLDRCRPETIVDLVRGMQTILRSPRVVFLILGDRDWIERAFEARNADMAKVGGGVEQSLGARFVEKAIQMSFLLPGMGATNQSDYVRGLLDRRGAGAPAATSEAAVRLREKVRETAANRGADPFNAQALRDQARRDWAEAKAYAAEAKAILTGAATGSGAWAAPTETQAQEAADREVSQIINEELAIHAAAAPEVEAETARRLQPLAPWLPPNPRQIKRILNGVALYHAVALQHPSFSTAGDRWFQLALWVVIMTEWPMTWRLLVACPELADVIAHATPAEALKALPAGRLPGSYAATLPEVERICADKALMALITGADNRPGPKLNTVAVQELLAITPPHGRATRLAEPARAKPEPATEPAA